uniref:Fatty acid desaturase domain-containing protein n=1 Tax=Haptolina brevifila TaxID=156173 RepID=A0A7S2J590_9EUKA
MLILIGPPIGIVIGSTVVWEAIDRGFAGGLVESGQELSGLIFGRIIPWIERLTKPINKHFVKHEDDSFLVNFALFTALGLPLLLTTFGRLHLACKSTAAAALLCYAYHVIRIGPFFMNFAYVYSVCHKEGHAQAAKTGLFAPPLDKSGPLRYIFNWWVGLFFGVLPSSFAVGHSINHHKYNNGPSDVVSTSDKPRDDWRWLIAYIPRFTLYACNISTTAQFIKEGLHSVAFRTVLGTLYYLMFVALVAKWYGAWFSFAYIIYPFLEQSVMLSGINWVWHAFLDPNDVENEYVQSITILGGTINVLNEDSHVVHHQYPGVHWSTHPKLLTKHGKAYETRLGSVFYGTHTFEMLALILLRDYDKLAERFVGRMPENAETELFGCGTHDKTKVKRPTCPISHDEAKELIKARLRACWWGPRATHNDPTLLSDKAGQSFARAHEWEAEGTLGWDDKAKTKAE